MATKLVSIRALLKRVIRCPRYLSLGLVKIAKDYRKEIIMENIMITYESSEDATDFVELCVMSGDIECDSKFLAEIATESDSYISFIRGDGSLPVSIAWDCAGRKIIVSCCENETWDTLAEVEVNTPDIEKITTLEITKADGFIRIECVKRYLGEINVELNDVCRVGGSGGIRKFAIQSRQCTHGLSDKILKKLPGKNQKHLLQADDGLIYDFGLHNGNDTDYYLKKGYKVIAVEASPILSELAAKRFEKEIEGGGLVLANIGVSNSGGIMPFFISLVNAEQSSFDEEFARRLGPVRKIEVETARPIDFFKEFGVPYYVKIDIEGYDLVVLDDILSLPIKPKYLSFECAPIGWTNYLPLLRDSGYSRFKIVNQLEIKGQSAPIPAKEGRTIDYKFLQCSSGSFGEDTSGAWMTAEDVAGEFECILKRMQQNNYEVIPWFDIHVAQ